MLFYIFLNVILIKLKSTKFNIVYSFLLSRQRDIIDIINIESVEPEFEEIKIIVSSIRLDNFVSELARCSRSKADTIIEEQRVFINSELQYKSSKKINEGDIITIRGKGKFIYDKIDHETKSGKYLVCVKKYI